MVCKCCGCENLDEATHCIYCGEPLEKPDESVGNIMSAFAGVSIEEPAESDAAVSKHAGITVLSAVNRLRRTDVGSTETLSQEEEEKIQTETLALTDDVQAEQMELDWKEEEPVIPEDEDLAEQLSIQAAEIVSRAVEKIVGQEGKAEEEQAENGQEAAAPEPAAAGEEEVKEEAEPVQPEPVRTYVAPENPLDFTMEEVPEKEADEEPIDHNFVQAAAVAAPVIQAGKSLREESPAETWEESESPAQEPEGTSPATGEKTIDFIPNIALTGTSEIMKESREEEKREKEKKEEDEALEAERIRKKRKQKRRRNSWIWILLLLLALFGIAYLLWIRPADQYKKALDLMEKGNYREALSLFEKSGDYKDSRKMADECLTRLGITPTDPDVPGTSVQPTESLPSRTEPPETVPPETKPPVTDPASTLPEETTQVPPESTEEVTPGPSESSSEETTPEPTPEETTSTPVETTPVAAREFKAGEIVRFGHYEQDNNFGNGSEEIEWIVLEAQGDRVLLISRYILDSSKYLDPSRWATYSSSGIRLWLDNDFYNAAFSGAEKQYVLLYDVDPGVNPKYPGISQGAVVDDHVGLLSVPQVEKYFPSAASRQCTATAYAKAKGVYAADNGFSPWWTSTMGQNNESACLARSDGAINYNGRELVVWVFGARPVICVSTAGLD